MNQLNVLEEFDITQSIQMPHLMFPELDDVSKRKIAESVFGRKPDEVLLITSLGFETSSVVAGLSLQAIEYIAKNAPLEYRESIWSVIDNGAEVKDMLKIAKAMDDGRGNGSRVHQERVLNLIQYVKDNQVAFQG